MRNEISDTGFWISNEDSEHVYIPQLSKEINDFVHKNNIKTVYDFGCGKGEYLKYLVEFDNSIEATGFEGHQTNGEFNNIVKADLSKKLTLSPVDMVISIEVGEHIPVEFEQVFIDNVCSHAKDYIILSWAVKGQGGLGHVNCKNNDYVINEVEKRGWTFDKETTNQMRNMMPNIWIKNTLMVFIK